MQKKSKKYFFFWCISSMISWELHWVKILFEAPCYSTRNSSAAFVCYALYFCFLSFLKMYVLKVVVSETIEKLLIWDYFYWIFIGALPDTLAWVLSFNWPCGLTTGLKKVTGCLVFYIFFIESEKSPTLQVLSACQTPGAPKVPIELHIVLNLGACGCIKAATKGMDLGRQDDRVVLPS